MRFVPESSPLRCGEVDKRVDGLMTMRRQMGPTLRQDSEGPGRTPKRQQRAELASHGHQVDAHLLQAAIEFFYIRFREMTQIRGGGENHPRPKPNVHESGLVDLHG